MQIYKKQKQTSRKISDKSPPSRDLSAGREALYSEIKLRM